MTHDAITPLARPEVLVMQPYSSARSEGDQSQISIFLDANENPYPPWPPNTESEELNRYPEPQPQHLITLFASFFKVDRTQLLISRGADEAIDLLVRAFCSAGKDAILINPPTFPMYMVSADIQNAAVYAVPLKKTTTFELDVEEIVHTCHEHAHIKLVFACSPNNPTGGLLRREDILLLSDVLVGKSLVAVDETYIEFSGQPSLARTIDEHPNLVVLRTLSKEYSLAGERFGFIIAHPEVINILGRILTAYPLTRSAIRAVTQAMSPEGIAYAQTNIRHIVEQRKLIEKSLSGLSSVRRIWPSDTNFLLIEVDSAKLLCQMMESSGIRIRDRSGTPGAEGCVRISVGTPQQNTEMLRVFAQYDQVSAATPRNG